MKRKISILAILLTISQPMALASIPQSDKTIDWKSMTAPEGFGPKYFTKANVERYFPTNLTPTTNGGAFGTELQSKMGQRITDDILSGDFFQKSSAAKMARSIQEMTDKSVSFGDPLPGHTVHTFKFQVRAVERLAEMKYSGYFDSVMTYNSDNNIAKLSITHPVDQQLILSFTETNNFSTGEYNPNLSLTYNF